MTPKQKAALERLIKITEGRSGQCATVASFLLAWWNSVDCGGFNLRDLWTVDSAIAADMIEVCRMIADTQNYPDTLGYKSQFEEMVARWRPAFGWWDGLKPERQAYWRRQTRAMTIHDAFEVWSLAEREREIPESRDG
jgi:hypothetical protein